MNKPQPKPLEISAALTSKLEKLRDVLTAGLVERDVAVRLALLGALAGEHLLMLGPPGTAKSLIARRLHLAFDDATYFERLLTRFSVPEELFGPLSIKGLEEDRYERLTQSYLPTASIAFLDEIFKANSAILNSLLTLLNEREFDNGTTRENTPLIAVIGASNELPEGEELAALYDRFLLRLHVGPVSDDGFKSLLGLRGQAVPVVPEELKLREDEIHKVQRAAEAVEVPADVISLLCELRDWCTAHEVPVSDRRWRKIVHLLQVAAISNGRDTVSIWDCWLLQHCIWDLPEDRERVYEWYAERVGASHAMDPARLTRIVVAFEAKLNSDRAGRSQMRNDTGQLLYQGRQNGYVTKPVGDVQQTRNGEPLYLAPPNACDSRRYNEVITDRTNGGDGYTVDELDELSVRRERHTFRIRQWDGRDAYLANTSSWFVEEGELPPVLEPTRYSKLYIDAQTVELGELLGSIADYRERLEQHTETLESDIRSHLWVTDDFAQIASQSLAETWATLEQLRKRVERVRAGFFELPLARSFVAEEEE